MKYTSSYWASSNFKREPLEASSSGLSTRNSITVNCLLQVSFWCQTYWRPLYVRFRGMAYRSWFLFVREILASLCVCSNRKCLSPSHLVCTAARIIIRNQLSLEGENAISTGLLMPQISSKKENHHLCSYLHQHEHLLQSRSSSYTLDGLLWRNSSGMIWSLHARWGARECCKYLWESEVKNR